MAQVSFVSILNAVNDFVTDTGLSHDEIEEPTLIKWAEDCISWLKSSKELTRRLAVIQIENSRGKLPVDFQMLGAAAGRYKRTKQEKTTREHLIQWSQIVDKDCNLEINLVCKRCTSTPCKCQTPSIEVNVDELWIQAHPEAFYKGYDRIGRFGYGPGKNGVHEHKYEFQLMRYATTNNFFNLKNVVAQCPNIECKNAQNEFVIDLPYIEVDFEIGEVLISYLGKRLDDAGNLMIPAHPDLMEAIVQHLRYKYYQMEGSNKKDQFLINLSNQAMQLRDQHLKWARESLNQPSYHEFKSYLEDSSMLKRIPQWSGDYPDGKAPDLYKGYLE